MNGEDEGRGGGAPEKWSPERIREYWTNQANTHRQAPSASWSDNAAIQLEIREILIHLRDGDSVLDVGCANGYSTVQFATHRNIQIRGVDYVPEMVRQATARLAGLPEEIRRRIHFGAGNITELPEPSETCDKVIATRVVINIGDWDGQLRGLRECARVLKRGGRLLLSEATLQGWRRLNALRREWGLAEIPMPPFNRYVDETAVVEALKSQLDLEELSNFSSTYFVGTRLLKPILAQALATRGIAVDVANPDMEWNRWLSQLPAWGDYGTQKLFVFRKR